MAKRSIEIAEAEYEAARASKKLKHISASESTTKDSTPTQTSQDLHNGQTNDEQLSKAEAKALKRAMKEKKRTDASANSLSDADSIAKAQRKALRRAEKAARKAEKKDRSNGVASTSGTTSATVSTPEAEDLSYREHELLTALSQAEIDAFTKKHTIAVEDPLRQAYRPIVAFRYLPAGETLRASFAKFSAPTPIQAACWPYLLAGRDVVGVAETGSGKTLAFGVPCIRYIAQLDKKERQFIRSCMVSPTRELAVQIYEQLVKIAQPVGLKVVCVYGGMPKDEQREAMRGAQIVVATPGRLNDFIQEGAIDLSHVNYLVLDEADRMLDKGFEEEVRKIISTTPSVGRQTLMFTATWPPSVRDLASTFMTQPVKILIGENATGELRANTRITQEVEVMEDLERRGRLIQLLKQYHSGKNRNDRILVFCLYKKEATRIEEFIRSKGFSVAGIHGDLNQLKRTESLEAFKQGRVPLLVATDVAARGLDIPSVKVVINFTFPLTVEDYVHRIGRFVSNTRDDRQRIIC